MLLFALFVAVLVLADDCQIVHNAYPSVFGTTCCGLTKGNNTDGVTYSLVQCDTTNYITRLEMNNQQLQGQTLFDFGSLTRLTYISLYRNGGLIGSLPQSLPSNLVYIGILENIQGSIPALPTKLQTLYVETTNNGLRGYLPQLPTTLTFLQLLGGALSGGLPATLPPNLQKLDLHGLGLTGSIPDSFSSLAYSQRSLDGNCFSNAASFGVKNSCPGGIETTAVGIPSTTSTPNTTDTAIANSDSGSSTNVGLIAGVAVGLVLLIAAGIIGCFCWMRKRKDDAERQAAVARYAEPFLATGQGELAPLPPLSSMQNKSPAEVPTVFVMANQPITVNNATVSNPSELISLTAHASPVPVVQPIVEKVAKQDLYSNIVNLAAVGSGDSNASAASLRGNDEKGLYTSIMNLAESNDSTHHETSKSIGNNLPQDPHTWSVAETAAWIAQNGGRVEGAKRAAAQLIDGNALLEAEDSKEVLDIVQCETYGERMRLKNALIALKERVLAAEAPPSYMG